MREVVIILKMKSSTFRYATLLVASCFLVLVLSVFTPLAHAPSPWVKTYDTSDNPTTVFDLGDIVRIKAYSDITPYYIYVEDPTGITVFTDTSNTASYSKDVTGITTTLGAWNITLVAQQLLCGVSILAVADLCPPCDTCTLTTNNPSMDLWYVGRDLTTLGNWTDNDYGDCGYALPFAETPLKQVAIGKTTGIGEPAHEFWWREPWSIPGPKDYSYNDYLGGINILKYNITGPKGHPRPLVNASNDYYRPSWYCNETSITVTLTGITGNYNLSLYFLDWDAPGGGMHRNLEVNVTSGGAWATTTLGDTFTDNFAAGTYAIFEIHSDGTIKIEVIPLGWNGAVISGVFLDALPGSVTGVNFIGFDRETKGNWRPTYGNSYYLLAGFNVPTNGTCYNFDKSYDVTDIPSGNYDVSVGVGQYAGDIARTYGDHSYIGQYAAYEWLDNSTATALDTRMLMYPVPKIYNDYPPTPLDRRYFGVWDSGELGHPLNYFIMNLSIPDDRYIFSIYAADFEQVGRSETIEIWDSSMTNLLDSQYITSAEINNGIYVKWLVQGPRNIIIKVIADPGKLNSFINGIFLNCLCPPVVGQFFVIPEVPLGTLAATIMCFAGLALKRIRHKK